MGGIGGAKSLGLRMFFRHILGLEFTKIFQEVKNIISHANRQLVKSDVVNWKRKMARDVRRLFENDGQYDKKQRSASNYYAAKTDDHSIFKLA